MSDEEKKAKRQAREKVYYEANKEKRIEQKKVYRESNKERLREQKKVYREANKEKIAAAAKVWYKANKDKIAAKKKVYREVNKEKIRAYLEANKDKIVARGKVYREANKEKSAYSSAKRKASKLQRTPHWLTEDDNKWILWHYKHAKKMGEITGIPHHVDHIVPLQGENVSGLHCPINLQVIPASENLSKNNTFDI